MDFSSRMIWILVALNGCFPSEAIIKCKTEDGENLPLDSQECNVSISLNTTTSALHLKTYTKQWAREIHAKQKSGTVRNHNIDLRYFYLTAEYNKSVDVVFSENGGRQGQIEDVAISASTTTGLTHGKSAVVLVASLKTSHNGTYKTGAGQFSQALSSDVLTVSAYSPVSKARDQVDSNLTKVSVPITYRVLPSLALFRKLESGKRTVVYSSASLTCVYLDTNSSEWSAFGCKTVRLRNGRQTCHCNHTSSFAVVLSVRSFKVPSALQTFANVAEGISVVSLFCAAAVLLWVRRHLQKTRFVTQFGMSLSLLLLHCSFLLSSLAFSLQIKGLCVFSAVSSHLFTLASAMWMLNEGVMLFFKTKGNSLKFDPDEHTNKLAISGWAFPVVFVSVCAVSGFPTDNYMSSNRVSEDLSPDFKGDFPFKLCWLSSIQLIVLAFPLVLTFAANGLIVAWVICKVQRMNRDAQKLIPGDLKAKRRNTLDRDSTINVTAHALFILMPILGVPWFLAVLVNIPGAEIYFISLHITLNGLQGLLVAFVILFKNRDVRRITRRKLYQVGRELTKSLDF